MTAHGYNSHMRPGILIGGFVLLMAATLALILLMHSGSWVALPAALLFFGGAALIHRHSSRAKR